MIFEKNKVEIWWRFIVEFNENKCYYICVMRLKFVKLYNEIAGFAPVFMYNASKSSFAVIDIASPENLTKHPVQIYVESLYIN